MTISYVGSASFTEGSGATPTGGTTGAIPVATQPGDVVFLFKKHEGAATGVVTITDNAAGGLNVFTSRGLVAHANLDLRSELFTSILTTGHAAHTFTIALGIGRAYQFFGVLIYRSTVGFTYFDHIGASGNGAAVSAGSKTPTGAYVAAMGGGEYTNTTWTQGAGWTSTLTPGSPTSYMQRRTNTVGEAITGNATSAVMDWIAQMAVFVEGGAPPSASLPPKRRNSSKLAALMRY